MTEPYIRTDDPDDSCAYCVWWEVADDDPMGDNAVPYGPDGEPVLRLYRYVHPACYEMAAAYTEGHD